MVARKLTEKEKKVFWEEKEKKSSLNIRARSSQ